MNEAWVIQPGACRGYLLGEEEGGVSCRFSCSGLEHESARRKKKYLR